VCWLTRLRGFSGSICKACWGDRSWRRVKFRSGFQPSYCGSMRTQGVALGWYRARRWRLGLGSGFDLVLSGLTGGSSADGDVLTPLGLVAGDLRIDGAGPGVDAAGEGLGVGEALVA
jgi:hypothetical protein